MITPTERAEIRASFERLLDRHCGESDVRRMMDQPGFDRALWNEIAALGLPGLLVPTERGGCAGGALDVEDVMEAAGAALLPGPLISVGVLGAGLLGRAADCDDCAAWLEKIASGDLIVAAALTDSRGTWTESGVGVAAKATADGWTLDGTADFVLDASVANLFLVAATLDDKIALFAVESGTRGMVVTEWQTADMSLRLGRIDCTGVVGKFLPLEGDPFGYALDLARIAVAGAQVGLSRHMLEMTVEYLKMREQFGRPIGSFQALKHMVADMLLAVESATSAVRAAASAFDREASDRKALIHLAAFSSADCAQHVTHQAIQLHGGIAFTWDHPAHLYWRRARAQAQLFGAPDWHREQYLQAMLA